MTREQEQAQVIEQLTLIEQRPALIAAPDHLSEEARRARISPRLRDDPAEPLVQPRPRAEAAAQREARQICADRDGEHHQLLVLNAPGGELLLRDAEHTKHQGQDDLARRR
jgi:hypothetical protein